MWKSMLILAVVADNCTKTLGSNWTESMAGSFSITWGTALV